MPKRARTLPVVGWREWALLPDLCPIALKAKIDTGARTSALHAFNLRIVEPEPGQVLASFEVHPSQRSAKPAYLVEVPVIGFKDVRPSSGKTERRPVVMTSLVIGQHKFQIEVTLTARDAMGFRMLLGRAAMRRRFVVDPGRSYLQGEPQ